MIAKSRTFEAVKVVVAPSVLVGIPVVAYRSVRSAVTRTTTRGLVGVTKGSPKFGRSKGVRRDTHGSQR